jgi:hypothetical protein
VALINRDLLSAVGAVKRRCGAFAFMSEVTYIIPIENSEQTSRVASWRDKDASILKPGED